MKAMYRTHRPELMMVKKKMKDKECRRTGKVELCDADALPHGRPPSVAVGVFAEQGSQYLGV